MNNLDHYAILGLARGAAADEVRAAYRRLARELHPDRCKAADAGLKFQAVTEAYSVLSSDSRRAAYDRKLAEELRRPTGQTGRSTRPIRCSECGKITAQPRILGFRSTVGLVVWSRVRKWEGVFCSRCAQKAGLRASALTAAAGWWSPVGPFLSLWAIATNALGGSREREADLRLALFNAQVFLDSRNPGLAYALARHVKRRADGPMRQEAARIVAATSLDSAPQVLTPLKDPWRLKPGYLAAHAAMLGAPLLIAAAVLLLAF